MTSYRLEKEKRLDENPIGHAHNLYKKCHIYSTDLETDIKTKLAESIYKILRKSQRNQPLKKVFNFPSFMEVIEVTISNGHFELEKSAKAFLELERYFKLLYFNPWKTEFWTLKLYSGFYNAKVKSHLSKPEELFYLIGYKKVSDDQLVLPERFDRDRILDVCFECLVAAVECATINDMYNEIKHKGGEITDALEWRKTDKRPSEDVLADKLKARSLYCGLGNTFDYDPYPYNDEVKPSRKKIDDRDYDQLFVDVNPLKTMTKHIDDTMENEIPFMDDNSGNKYYSYPEATQDEHMKASLQEVKLKEERSLRRSKKNDNDWEYVNKKNLMPNENHDLDLKSMNLSLSSKKEDIIFVNGREGRRYNTTGSSHSNIVTHDKIYNQPFESNRHPATKNTPLLNNVSFLESSDSGARSQPVRTREGFGSHKIEMDGSTYMSNYFDASMNKQTTTGASSEHDFKTKTRISRRWICASCTAENDIEYEICGMCHKSKYQGPDLDIPKAGDMKKVCTSCTLENLPSAEICDVCHEKLKPCNVQTYV
ncbi:uncharacterized protein LOC126814445 [Patella vulgata]|uniref:uncharacterized protein LOC126814445 n=1 Tax=Patella vulgata TaxID=6465 RepID=UPI002180290F|nr:uncharacterized protein LOC126814445 [Patella vulgata]XP_050395532.1 uncharacterized protein LOC126814445 [Patella vulgata]XP_050395536.1 uncharacterized protein LOC126814445 [Patella vulgata]XP_055955377.1 uncharacterized protein LOC126814445 [Patella vulgata]